ncbi:nucleotide disphospho-sugar-binding domain-containing protein [Streptomyces sp. 4N509B]|uniref:nucleotide disphospho-sugar-binding domain-containing protein n=1 Tax=Streptomyces sp. 4N509B TaxID=3457413 RepID=UPI003FD57C0E
MRVLFTIFPGAAHLNPVVPLARAMLSAGHEVRVASHPAVADEIHAAGLLSVPLGEDIDIMGAVMKCAADTRLDRVMETLNIEPGDPGNRGNVTRYYMLAGFSLYYPAEPDADEPSFTNELIAFAKAWKPDLVLWDPLCFASPLAARAAGAAHARLLWGLDYFGWIRSSAHRAPGAPDPMAEAMAPVLQAHGETFDEELLLGQWSIDLMPERMRLTDEVRYLPLRQLPYTGAASVPDWLHGAPERPRVCLTLGVTVRKMFAEMAGFHIAELVEMVADMDIELVATLDESQLSQARSIPSNVRTIDYIPLDMLLPTCSAIVHHGSFGTFSIASAYGVPQLITPEEGGDGVAVADYLIRRGAGLSMGTGGYTAQDVQKQLTRLLEDPSFQRGADALYDEMLDTPTPNEVVPVLERLTARHRGAR